MYRSRHDSGMPRATGRRLLAAVFALIPILGWPFAYLFWRSARRVEKERERELAALESMADN